MYLNYYRLSREPFHITTTPGVFYMSKNHREALAMMLYGIQKRLGFMALTGEVGTGKTTVLRAYLEHVQSTNIRPVLLFNPSLSFDGLLRYLLHALGVDGRGRDERWMLQALVHALRGERKEGRIVALIVDEAHHIPVDTMSKMHLISNMEVADGKLLQVVFVGQPELDDLLMNERLRQIRQRIAVRFRLQPLTAAESIDYIRYRIEKAGGRPESVFTAPAMRAISKAARGLPRMINVLCDNALITGMGHSVNPVTPRVVREVVRDFASPRRRPAVQWATRLTTAAAIVAALGGTFWKSGWVNAAALFPDPAIHAGTDPAGVTMDEIAQ